MQDSEYYQKYIKYKTKYLKLKQKGGEPYSNISNNLYLKFITERLIAIPSDITVVVSTHGKRERPSSDDMEDEDEAEEVVAIAATRTPRVRQLPPRYDDYIMNLTQNILEYLSPSSKIRMEADMEIDNEIIKRLNELQELEDPEYKHYENHGKLIEAWIADNMCCPSCRHSNSLRRYLSDSMPVIDLVCINPNHTINHGVKFFQVKASNGALFQDKPYFNYDPSCTSINSNTIHTGSRIFGEPVHKIGPYDTLLDKKILCGYICIRYIEYEDNLRIDLINSMIVLPEYLLSNGPTRRELFPSLVSSRPVHDDDWYYCYIEPISKHNRIKFNLATNRIISNNKLRELLPRLSIRKSYFVRSISMNNPHSIIE